MVSVKYRITENASNFTYCRQPVEKINEANFSGIYERSPITECTPPPRQYFTFIVCLPLYLIHAKEIEANTLQS